MIIDPFIYAKMPPHLKKSINQGYLENGTYNQIVSNLERELELNGLEAPDEMPMNTVLQQAPQQNSEKPKPMCHHCKKPAHYQNQGHQFKREIDQTRNKTNSADTIPTIKMVVLKQTPTLTINFQTQPTRTLQIIKEIEDLYLSSHPVRPVVELTTPQRNVTLVQTQRTDRLPGIDDRKDKTKPNK